MKYNLIIRTTTLLLLGVFTPLITIAAEYTPLVGIPGLSGGADQNFGEYINALYRLAISIGALIAVVKIVGAGAKYMLSDIVTSKQAAIKDIRGAVFGLLIVIGAVVILNTINADIVNTSLTFNETTLTPAPPNEFENEMEAMCSSPDGCTIRTCIVAWSGCRTWCEDEMHGIVVVDGNFVDDCLTHNPRRFDCAIVPATPDVYDADGNIISPGNPSGFDCDAAEAQCESIDGDVTVLTSYVQCDAWDPGLAT